MQVWDKLLHGKQMKIKEILIGKIGIPKNRNIVANSSELLTILVNRNHLNVMQI